ncbi:hypothetical protein [Oleiharenicola sp. Vm1]|uniref:hypothetical protein n=1 Tax=Oleiharenicola sp. Vm1 TaxID=3398393 RepID=UPI0039F469DB
MKNLPAHIPPRLRGYVSFYEAHPALALPHRNPYTGHTLRSFTVECDCGRKASADDVHGVINDYPMLTEVRYVTGCPACHRLIYNSARLRTDGAMVLLKDGEWVCCWPNSIAHRFGALLRRIGLLP